MTPALGERIGARQHAPLLITNRHYGRRCNLVNFYIARLLFFFQCFSDAVIRASAQNETDNTKPCSGGAGGLIRLKALQVTNNFTNV